MNTSSRSQPISDGLRPTTEGAEPSAARAWLPHERNYSGNRVGVQVQPDDWTILTVESGGAVTTTSIRKNEAWDLAQRLSPEWEAEVERLHCENRKLRDAAYDLGTCRETHIEHLRATADEIDCGDDCDYSHTEYDTNAHVCQRGDEECAFYRACQLRELAAALETVKALNPSAQDTSALQQPREDQS